MQPNAAKPCGPSADEVRAQLARIIADRKFVRSERLRRFLLLTVEKTLSGGASQISEYVLGREVFDRDGNYDPRIDSIVRVEARRLRTKLAEYYQGAGAGDPIVIEFDPGSYVPAFRYAVSPVTPAPTLNPSTVAVLPFVNISADPEQEFFCDGITEEILNALAGVPELNVVARTSVFHFKNANVDVREIGTRLNAGTVIEGSVRKGDHNLRISVKAINASTGLLLWSGNFDREASAVLTIQSEIAQSIANALRVTLAPARPQATNLEAYTFYLKGRYYWNQNSPQGIQDALLQFSRAIAKYPEYAQPYAALADAYGHLGVWGAIPPDEAAARARQSAIEALRLDSDLADAYATLGGIASIYEWRWEEAEKLLRRAIELQPSNVHAYELYALHLTYRGRFAEASAAIEKALQLDPLSPRGNRIKAWQHYYQREYPQAIAILEAENPLDSSRHEGRAIKGWAYLRLGRYREAIAEFDKLPDGPFLPVKLGALGEAYASEGQIEKARDALRQLEAISRERYVSLRGRVYIYAALGDWDRVFADLQRSREEHAPWLVSVRVDPRFDPIRDDPRFVDILMSL